MILFDLQDFETAINAICASLGLTRTVKIALDEANGVSKVEYYTYSS